MLSARSMFLTDSLPNRRYDCYVIGAGPAGITLALELARANRTVLVFETGTVTDQRDDMPNVVNYGHFRDGWWDYHSRRVFGGTSRVWAGWCATHMEVDFDNPAAGVRWPITRSDLIPYYRRAAPVVDRHPAIVDPETPLAPGFAYRPFSESESGTQPTRFGRKYREEVTTSSLVDVAVGTSVVGLDANPSRSAVRGVTWFRHASGATDQLDLEPRQNVVLAGGGISNAQLLLQPRADGASPIGNESGLAGKYLIEHPQFWRVAEVVLDEDLDQRSRPADFGAAAHALVPTNSQMRRHGLLGCGVSCHSRTRNHPMAEHLAGEYRKPFHHYVCDVGSEMAPTASNEVFLTGERDRGGLFRPAARCVIGAGDFLTVERTLRLLGESLIASEKGRVRINNERLYRQIGGWGYGGGHIMGTTRMGTTVSNSVVDPDCRVHGYDNLFVAGSSVFPTGGYANPTLTIVALSLRLADTLTATP